LQKSFGRDMEGYICLLCGRKVPEITDHHVVPRSYGGSTLIQICRDCHRQLHVLYDNKTLATRLNTVEAILADEQFGKYLKWVEKRPFGAVHKARRSKDTRRRGRKG
jgi:5-methylcytosine-specific restriction protein A